MPNGKGSASCGECKHCLLYHRNTNDIDDHGLCTLWNTRIPLYRDFFEKSEYTNNLLIAPGDFDTLNLICKDYSCRKQHGIVSGLAAKVRKRLQNGLLYAAHYNVMEDPNEYYKVVCILDEKLKFDAAKLQMQDYWLEESCTKYIGRKLVLSPIEDCDFFRDDPEQPDGLFERLDNKPFHLKLRELWDHFGLRYGGLAKIEERGHPCDSFWVIFSVNKAGIFNFEEERGVFNVRLGPDEFELWNGKWPRFATGAPRYFGWGEIRVEEGG